MLYEVNDINLNVERAGSDSPLLLLHGFSGSTKTWEPFIPLFARKYQTITLDIIGHGNSDAPSNPARYTMAKAALDIITLLDQLHIETVHLLGYSMGGRLALMIACHYPERIRSLILESSSPGLPTDEERIKRRAQDEQLAAFIEQKGLEAFFDYWENIPLFFTQKRVPLEKRLQLRESRLIHSKIGLANSLRGMGTGRQPSLWEQLPNLSIPVRLLVGEHDNKFNNIAKEMDKLLPSSETSIAANVGHNIHFESPDLFAKIVLDFLHSFT